MTPKERAAMQQALEALESYSKSDYIKKQHPKRRANGEKAIAALREALAEQAEGAIVKTCPDGYGTITTEQAEQEPVAIDGLARACNLAGIDYKDFLRIKAYLPIAAPVRTKDLTDDEIAQAVGSPLDEVYLADFRAVIAADREKNK